MVDQWVHRIAYRCSYCDTEFKVDGPVSFSSPNDRGPVVGYKYRPCPHCGGNAERQTERWNGPRTVG